MRVSAPTSVLQQRLNRLAPSTSMFTISTSSSIISDKLLQGMKRCHTLNARGQNDRHTLHAHGQNIAFHHSYETYRLKNQKLNSYLTVRVFRLAAGNNHKLVSPAFFPHITSSRKWLPEQCAVGSLSYPSHERLVPLQRVSLQELVQEGSVNPQCPSHSRGNRSQRDKSPVLL